MFTTSFLYDVIYYGRVVAVALLAIDLLVFLIRAGRRSDCDVLGMVSVASEAAPDPNPQRQRIVGHSAATPAKRQRGTETAADPLRASMVASGASRRAEKGRRVPEAHENVRGYIASNGIMLTPNVIGSGCGSAIGHPVSDHSAALPTHPHAEYWTYGDLRFYEHQ